MKTRNQADGATKASRAARGTFLTGALAGGALVYVVLAFCTPGSSPQALGGGDGAFPPARLAASFLSSTWAPSFGSQLGASAPGAYGDGRYIFLPNRRSVWVVQRDTGRIANYHFRDNEEKTVLRSRVVSVNQSDFPPGDTVYLLSDRNLTSVLWVCNERTGDVQLWNLQADGDISSDGQIVTSIDLMKK